MSLLDRILSEAFKDPDPGRPNRENFVKQNFEVLVKEIGKMKREKGALSGWRKIVAMLKRRGLKPALGKGYYDRIFRDDPGELAGEQDLTVDVVNRHGTWKNEPARFLPKLHLAWTVYNDGTASFRAEG